jgi:hypothetical protein
MKNTQVARLLAFVSGMVNQKLLLQNEYLVAENRILRAQLRRLEGAVFVRSATPL